MYALLLTLVLHSGGVSPKPFGTVTAPTLVPKPAAPAAITRSYLQTIGLGAYLAYRATLSSAKAPNCAFRPSCSAYGHEAIDTHGLIPGLFLFAARLIRAHLNYGAWAYPGTLDEPWLEHSLDDSTAFINHIEKLPWISLFSEP
jgi:putative component of membrane protein insertase Oxa1/YidC/SpoIIIJ protein YidD